MVEVGVEMGIHLTASGLVTLDDYQWKKKTLDVKIFCPLNV